jgi:hypothetical protein
MAAGGSNTAAQESTLSPACLVLNPIPVVPHCQGTV